MQYAKVAEYQARGVVHFHALIRLDGLRSKEGFEPAPTGFDAARLATLIRDASAAVRYMASPVHAGDTARVLSFGAQTDARPVRVSRRPDDPEQALAPEQVAGYLAKYATKSATDSASEAGRSPHLSRLRATVRDCADRALDAGHRDHLAQADPAAQPYLLLGKWVHMLGFRGHFATKSRRYSVTLGRLRRARQRAQVLIAASRESGVPVDLAALDADLLRDEEEGTTLVVGHWQFLKAGWDTAGDEALARAAAARAREYAQHKAQMKRTEGEGPQRDSSERGTS